MRVTLRYLSAQKSGLPTVSARPSCACLAPHTAWGWSGEGPEPFEGPLQFAAQPERVQPLVHGRQLGPLRRRQHARRAHPLERRLRLRRPRGRAPRALSRAAASRVRARPGAGSGCGSSRLEPMESLNLAESRGSNAPSWPPGPSGVTVPHRAGAARPGGQEVRMVSRGRSLVVVLLAIAFAYAVPS